MAKRQAILLHAAPPSSVAGTLGNAEGATAATSRECSPDHHRSPRPGIVPSTFSSLSFFQVKNMPESISATTLRPATSRCGEIFVGVIQLAAQVFHRLPRKSGRIIGLAARTAGAVFEKGIVPHRRQQCPGHAPAGHGIPPLAVEAARRAADVFAAQDEAPVIVAGTGTVTDALQVILAVLAPVVRSRELCNPATGLTVRRATMSLLLFLS